MLVTLEGLDGSGKTTVVRALRDRYPAATVTREPTESWYGQAVARSINNEAADPLAELFLYTADHADHLSRVVRPALERGDDVISDRFADSRYAYQGATLEGVIADPMGYVRRVHDPFTITPDLTLYLDIDAETAAERSGATNKFERVERLRAVRTKYEQLLEQEPDRFVRIDASQPKETVASTAIAAIEDERDTT